METAELMPREFPRAPRLLALLTAAGLLLGLAVAGPVAPAAADPPLAAELARAQQQLHALALRVDLAVEDYDAARVALAEAQRRSTAAQERVLAARRDLHRKQGDLGAIAATAYRTGGTDVLALMVSGNAADFLDRAASLDQLSRNQADVVRAVGLAAKQVAERQQAADSALAEAQSLERRMAAAKTTIERDLAAQARLVDRLKAEQVRLERIAAEKAAAAARAAAVARVAHARAAARAAAAQA
ncbi:MAG: coiled-coil domain-containing protein, partial [Mycobacteriales bacterium]